MTPTCRYCHAPMGPWDYCPECFAFQQHPFTSDIDRSIAWKRSVGTLPPEPRPRPGQPAKEHHQ